jgi:SAM-dependent methyltransferase
MKRCINCSFLFASREWTCPSCRVAPGTVYGFPSLAPGLAAESDGFQSHFHAELAALEQGNFWFQARNELIVWALQRYYPGLRSFLEIGCGTGFVLSSIAAQFPDASLTGSEIFSSGLPFAAGRVPRAELIQMDARSIPYEEHFDVVGAFDVLEHIKDDERVLQQIHGSLRAGGGLIVTVPQHRWLWSHQDIAACHVRRYQAVELRQKVKRSGFSIILETSFMSLLLPLMYLSRMRKKDLETYDPLAELRIGGLANRALLIMMQLEGFLIRSGLRMPLGGSRLLVARKA